MTALSIQDAEWEETHKLPYEEQDGEEARLALVEEHPRARSEYESTTLNEQDLIHNAFVCRTIVAAARGGQLKRLDPASGCSEYPFKIRSLLPCWVRIEEWGPPLRKDGLKWAKAANSLRPFLAHASLRKDWLAAPSNSSADLDRRLTHQELQLLPAYFQSAELEDLTQQQLEYYEPLITHYLPWLVEDAELAQQVLDVWNNMVEQGEADKVECKCPSCVRD